MSFNEAAWRIRSSSCSVSRDTRIVLGEQIERSPQEVLIKDLYTIVDPLIRPLDNPATAEGPEQEPGV